MADISPRSGRLRFLPFLVVLALALLALGPLLLERGFALVADMVFVPDQPWKPTWLGLDGSPPRAVPADALVSIATQVLPGDLLQKVILLGSLVLAGTGMLRLLGDLPAPVRLGAAVLYVWNPYVYERLAIGHWGLLVGYAALPWVLRSSTRLALDVPGALPRLVVWTAVAAAGSPTGGLLAGGVALAGSLGAASGTARAMLRVVAVTLVVNLPWLVPGLLQHATTSDTRGVEAFASAADTPMGALGSLLTLGGIWKESAVPEGRSSLPVVLLMLALVVAALVALMRSALPAEALRRRSLAVLAVASLLLAALPTAAWGAELVGQLVEAVPGAGLLRDSQKWLAPFVLVVAVGFGALLAALQRWWSRHVGGAAAVTVAAGLVPVVLLPTMAWGMSGRLSPATYPAEWTRAAKTLSDQRAEADRTVVLPWSAYRRFDWNGLTAFLDPASRFLPGRVLTNGDLDLGAVIVRGDDEDAAEISRAIDANEPLEPVLEDLGVRWVLIEKSARPSDHTGALDGRIAHDGPELRLLDLGETNPPSPPGHGWLVITVDLLVALVVLAAAAAGWTTSSWRRRAVRSGRIPPGALSTSDEGNR